MELVMDQKVKLKRKLVDKNLVPINALDLSKTILLDRGKHSLKAIPLSQEALQKLVMLSTNFEPPTGSLGYEYRSYVDYLLSYDYILNTNGLDKDGIITNWFNNNGLNIVLSQHAQNFLDKRRREFNRLILPFKFYIPEQFQDIGNQSSGSESTISNLVSGPYVEDICADEIAVYKKRINQFGWDNPKGSFHLFDYQIDDIARLACKKRAFIGLEQGLGKTSIAIGVCHMHGHKRVLVVSPKTAIGSWQSGWRYEIHRMGVPKENIHVMDVATDLPTDWNDTTKYPDNGRPHFFLTNYNALSQEKIVWQNYKCPNCGNLVAAESEGKCSHYHSKPPYAKTLNCCPQCYYNATIKDKSKLEEYWTGSMCDKGKGGCGWRLWSRVPYAKNTKAGDKDPRPMWKRIRRGMFDVGLIDESQLVRNIDARRSKAVQNIPGFKRCYIITGTMVTNFVQDTFWQLQLLFKGRFPIQNKIWDFATCKGYLAKAEAFLEHFQCGRQNATQKAIPTLRNKEALWSLMSTIQVRRRSDDPEVDQQIQLPKINYTTELIEMDSDHKAIYSLQTKDFKQSIGHAIAASPTAEKKDAAKVLASLSITDVEQRINKLRQYACVPEIDPAYRKPMTNKDKRIMELIDEEIKQSNKVVLFSSYQMFIEKYEELCKNAGYKPMRIDGRVPTAQRWTLIDQWRSDPDYKVMIAGIKSMNYAVNFTSVSPKFNTKRVIFAAPEWSPSEMEQAWKRVHRIGQNRDVEVYFVYHKDTVEHYMSDLLYQKKKTAATIIDRIHNLGREDQVIERSAVEIAKIIINV